MSAAASPPGPAPMMPDALGPLRARDGSAATQPSSQAVSVMYFSTDADGDRAVARLLDDAVAFAEPVLRADAAADLGEGVGRLAELIGLAQPALGGQLQPVGDVVVQRAVRLAVGHAALLHRPACSAAFSARELAVNLAEILAPRRLGGRFSGMSRSTVTNLSIRCSAMLALLRLAIAPQAEFLRQRRGQD